MFNLEKIERYQVIISCLIITFGILVSSLIFASKISKTESISTTGSAFKIVKSDSAKLSFDINARGLNQKIAFNILNKQKPQVIKYLTDFGINKKDIELKPAYGYYNYKSIPNSYAKSDEILDYSASQMFEIKSSDVEKIKEISLDIQKLTELGIVINVHSPEYYYSDYSSIKVDLLKEAALDAKNRAKSMLSATNSKVGKVKQIRMGVFQITPVDSTMVSDVGVNDTSSIDKKITAVASVVFNVK